MKPDVRVGPAGWSYDDWKGVVYPAVRPQGFHEASYLAQYFSLIEINTSFYRPLRPELARLWVKKIEIHPRFQFTAKLYRGFTHERRLEREEIRQFCDGLAPLMEAGRLGCVLMQFPWSFRFNPETRKHLIRLKRAFGHYPLVAEVRHSSWNRDQARKVFLDHQIGFCNIDQPQLQQCLPPSAHVTSTIGYIRFHGRNYQEWFNFEDESEQRGGLAAIQARYNYLYTQEQLEKWRGRIDEVAGQTVATYVVTNNHFQGKAVVNALQLLALLSDEKVETPPELLEHYPELHPVARNSPVQRSLFHNPPSEPAGQSAETRTDPLFDIPTSASDPQH